MQDQRNKMLTERIAARWVRVHTALVLLFLVAPILAIMIWLGFSLVPIAVLAGVIR